ncbi:MAG: ketoacyl-ACP synthase III [Actinobacteria bacterium]|jgi:3-oxoacyl-[acyl-carrier-protein] synthase-3|nr:ketoacyl-ACP synthase III [Actinomycetota bacterium]
MRTCIAGWGAAVPDGRLTNADLEARVETTAAWIVERTGIHERRVAADDETTASLAVAAGAAAIKRAGCTPDDIDLLLVATATPEQPIPHTGAFVGDGLGLRCGSFDLNVGCAGFIYGIITGSALLQAGHLRRVLVVGAETLSRVVDPRDRGTCILFGDGAAAVVLAPADDDGPGILGWDTGCDGSAAYLIGIPAGGSRMPATPDTIDEGLQYIKMQGQEVFRRAVRAVVDSANLALERAGVTTADIDWFIPHQANLRIIEAAAHRLGIDRDRTIVNIDRFGNTSAASIPLAMAEAADAGRLRDGDLLLMSGFGAGMSWASAVLRWGQA